jgi:hypothetical protein
MLKLADGAEDVAVHVDHELHDAGRQRVRGPSQRAEELSQDGAQVAARAQELQDRENEHQQRHQ